MNTNIENFYKQLDTLPDTCQTYLRVTGTQSALSTRLQYAIELNNFFDWLILNTVTFFDVDDKKHITIDLISKITTEDISNYISSQSDRGLKERTVARKRAALSSFFTYLVNARYLQFNPVIASARVKIQKSDQVIYMNIAEQKQFLNTVDYGNGLSKGAAQRHERYRLRDMALLLLMLDTGMRVSEVHSIDVNMIDFEDCSVVVERKGHKIQKIYFSDEVKFAILDYLEERKITDNFFNIKEPLFVTTGNNRLSIRAIQVLVKKYSSSALPNRGLTITPHKLRSSFAMEFYGAQHDILALQRKLGHNSISTTNIYAKATDTQMKETRSVLQNRRNTEPIDN